MSATSNQNDNTKVCYFLLVGVVIRGITSFANGLCRKRASNALKAVFKPIMLQTPRSGYFP